MSKKILVIDDDPVGTRLIEYILKQRGYQVLTAPNGLEGLKKAQNEEPALVVLNIMLPGMDGFEVCHRLRTEDKTAQLPILILSGRAQPIDRATGFKMGADDYIAKPATPSEIINRVESLLARRTVANSRIAAVLSSGGKAGTTTIVVNVAIALAQMGKRVIAADLCPYQGSVSQRLGVKPQDSFCLPEALNDGGPSDELESALVVHQSGVRVLRILEPPAKTENVSCSNISWLFDGLGNMTDYFLVDLPFQPTAIARMVLTQCDLTIVVSDYTIESLTGVKSIVNVLHYLGISSERVGAVITDPRGTFPEMTPAAIRPYVESNLGILLLGIIPYDIKASVELSSDSAPLIISEPESPMAGSIKELAQQIISKMQKQKYSSRTVAKRA